MTKEDIVNNIYAVHGLLSKKEVAVVVENVFELI